MVFLEVSEAILCVLILLFFITQILIPAWKGLPWFPFFRPRRKELEDELGKTKEEIDNTLIEREIEEEKKEITRIKSKTKEKEEKEDGTKI